MGNISINQPNGIDGLMSFLNMLTENGEAKIEVSFRIKGAEEESSDSRPKYDRPYDPEGRIAGVRGIAKHLGLGVSSVQTMIRNGMIPIYRIGKRKMYAYDDEIMKSLASFDGNLNSQARSVLEKRGYKAVRVYRAVTQ